MKLSNMFGGGGIRFADPPARQVASGGGQGNGDGEGFEGDVDSQEEADDFGVFDEIFTQQEEEDDDDEGKQQQQQQQQTPPGQQVQPQQSDADKAMAAEIQRMITGIGVGENDIPENFDANDPKQLRDLLGKTQQKAAMTIMQATLKPVQAAMESMMSEIRNEIRTVLSEGIGKNKQQERLEAAIPEAKDPKFKEIVDVVYKNAMKNLKDETKALSATRKAIDAMGLPKSKVRDSDPSQGGSLKGKDALNLYAPLPQRNK